MTEKELFAWLRSQQSNLDSIIYKSGLDYLKKNRDLPNFYFDIEQCQAESFNLINSQDLCYDRLNTAFVYSLWYHARRVNTFLTFFARKLLSTTDDKIEIFDLGAGTGAVQWGVGLVIQAMKRAKVRIPEIRIINIDSSPFMLGYSKEYLWKNFIEHYPYSADLQIEYEVNSWNNQKTDLVSNPWITASYLFDMSDQKEIIRNDFSSLIETFKPSTVLLLTSAQNRKRELLNSLANDFSDFGYTANNVSASNLIYNGLLEQVNLFRKRIYLKTGIKSLNRDASWDDNSFVGKVLTRPIQQEMFKESRMPINTMSLYNPPFKVRREVQLNRLQRKASENTGMPTVIIGPAGCGKSVVITERVKNTVLESDYDPNIRILVTSFNKQLIKNLADWIEQLLSLDKLNRIDYPSGSIIFTFPKSKKANIWLVHFEMLAKDVGGIKYHWYEESQHRKIIDDIIIDIRSKRKDLNATYDSVLNSDFILEEYHRVIYGLECYKGSDYLGIKREGRGNNPTLRKGSERRKVVLECITRYNVHLKDQKIQSYITRRRHFLRMLERQEITKKFDYVFVDEFQDCTNADFKIFINLLKNPDHLILAGDLAQSIHIGNSSRIYRDMSMSKREFHRLKGSYRLPVRVAECIENIPKAILTRRNNEEGVNEITPYKGSPPGARPIVVFADSTNEMALKIKFIFDTYKIYELSKMTILEKDSSLEKKLHLLNLPIETDTILRLKGLEKECIVWSTRAEIEFTNEVFEFVYTILTRTSCILIIALFSDSKKVYKPVINLLREDRLIIWDLETKQKFKEFCELGDIEVVKDEE